MKVEKLLQTKWPLSREISELNDVGFCNSRRPGNRLHSGQEEEGKEVGFEREIPLPLCRLLRDSQDGDEEDGIRDRKSLENHRETL